MRDIGPTALMNNQGVVRTVSWQFNAWGGLVDGLYSPWDQDDQVAVKVSDLIGLGYYQARCSGRWCDTYRWRRYALYDRRVFVISRRNPHLNKAQIERHLVDYLNIEKVIWIPNGLYNDETNGHVDNLLHVIARGVVVLTWCDDPDDPQYQISREANEILSNTLDARGRMIKVIKLPMPGPFYLTEEEAAIIEPSEGMKRVAGERWLLLIPTF